jgi:hypothetical protein
MSGWQSKKASSNSRVGYSFSWTQPYANFNHAPSVSAQMAVIEAIDRLVESGLTHPLADRILNTLLNNFKE